MNSQTIFVCRLSTRHWSKLEVTGAKPSPRFGQAAAADSNGDLWVVGGTDGHRFLNDVWKFSFANNVYVPPVIVMTCATCDCHDVCHL
jgi:hypothetical protein